MNLKEKIYLIALLLFVTYMVSANYIFIVLIKVDDESSRVNLDLPEHSESVLFNIDVINEDVVRWKQIITIRGWGFIAGVDTEKVEHHIILKKDDKIFAFNTTSMIRKDVTEHYKDFSLNLDYAGFEAKIARGVLKKGEYQIGLLITVEAEEGYRLSDRYIEIK